MAWYATECGFGLLVHDRTECARSSDAKRSSSPAHFAQDSAARVKIRGTKFQVEAVGLQHRVEGEGEHLVHDASRRRVKKDYADAMTAW